MREIDVPFPLGNDAMGGCTRQISHLMSVANCPEGKRPMLRANMELIAGLVSLFGEDTAADGDAGAATQGSMDIDTGA